MTMLAVRIPDDTIDRIDLLVANGWVVNRTVFVREAIERALTDAANSMIDRQIAERLDHVQESPEQIQALKASTQAWIESLPDEDW